MDFKEPLPVEISSVLHRGLFSVSALEWQVRSSWFYLTETEREAIVSDIRVIAGEPERRKYLSRRFVQ